jgi:RNA polymerase primary sigma factor
MARVAELLGREVAFIDNPLFHRVNAEDLILVDVAAPPPPTPPIPADHDGPPYYRELLVTPLLSRDDEQRLFRRMNYCRFRANALRSKLNPRRPATRAVASIDRFLEMARVARDQIVKANLRLVISIARRFSTRGGDFEDLVADGNAVLLTAIDKFDFARGFRFSTYATHAIQRDFYRKLCKLRADRLRYGQGADALLANAPDPDANEEPPDSVVLQYRAVLGLIDQVLDDRERQVLTMRFGLDHNSSPRTLSVVAAKLGISKERVRQLQQRALETLRRMIPRGASC